MCNQRYGEVKEDLQRGKEKFDHIDEKLEIQGKSLAVIERIIQDVDKKLDKLNGLKTN